MSALLANSKFQHKHQASIAMICADALAFIAGFYSSSFLFVKTYKFLTMQVNGIVNITSLNPEYVFDFWSTTLFFMFAVSACITFLGKGIYTQRLPWWCAVSIIVKVVALSYLLDGFLHFAIGIPGDNILIFSNWFFSFAFLFFAKQLTYFYLRKKDLWNTPAVIIGDVNTISDALFAFETDSYSGYDIKTIIVRDGPDQQIDKSNLPLKYGNVKILSYEEFNSEFINNNADHFFIVTIEAFRGEARDKLIDLFSAKGVQYALIPSVKQTSYYCKDIRTFFGNDILLLHPQGRFFLVWPSIIKRGIDILASSLLLLLLSPIFILVPLLLKIEGQKGSVFYGGKRIGKNGKLFKCWKFTSMEPGSDYLLIEKLERDPVARMSWEKYHKLEDDPRITTHTAKIIRKLSVDELPQLFNVFLGDMSLVGPRPILIHEKEAFGEHFKDYSSVRPGITGVWQVSGRNNVSFGRRIYWDTWYALNWSIWGDIVILIKTIRVVFFRSGAH